MCSCSVTVSPSSATRRQRVADTLPMLADRIAAENGYPVVVGCLRGVGESAGDFSLGGWYDDLRALVDHAAHLGNGGGVWIVGFGTGGALGLCVAGDDTRVRGVACFGSPATFADWANEGVGMIEYARRVGAIRSAGFPSDRRAWGAAFAVLRPDESAAKLSPRPVLVVHGAEDEEVPIADGRRLAELAGSARRATGPGRSRASPARRPPGRGPAGGVARTSGALSRHRSEPRADTGPDEGSPHAGSVASRWWSIAARSSAAERWGSSDSVR